MKPYRTIEDVLRSPWANAERPGEKLATDRVLRSTYRSFVCEKCGRC